MPYSIIWSPTARISYLNILQFLEESWTHREVEDFAKNTKEILGLIRQNPLLFEYSNKSKTHRCVLGKQVSLFYRVKSRKIELLVFWDNRQDPAKLTL